MTEIVQSDQIFTLRLNWIINVYFSEDIVAISPQFRNDRDTTHNLVLECEDGSKLIYYKLIQLQTAQWGRIRLLSALTSSTLRPRNKSSKGSVLSPPLSSCRSFTWLRRSFSSSSLDGETKCLVTFCFTSIKFPLSGHLNRYSFKILDSTLINKIILSFTDTFYCYKDIFVSLAQS